tara:strand:+ start:1286 stop:1852 length:567 start_codon:yes stop_codon:yes gene_type:complete
MGYYGKSNAANPALIAATELTADTTTVIFDGVFNAETKHYKLIITGAQIDHTNSRISFARRLDGSTLGGANVMVGSGYLGNVQAGETTAVETNVSTATFDYDASKLGTNATRQALHVVQDIFPTVKYLPTDLQQNIHVSSGDYYDDAGDVFMGERAITMKTGVGYDGVIISAQAGNLSAGKFYIYAMV